DAVVAARGREDLRIDSDDLAAHVEQRSTGVAGIYGDVRLDERQELARIARFGADDAGSDRVVQAERRADGDDPFADTQFVRVADLHTRKAGRLDLHECDVGAAVSADDL